MGTDNSRLIDKLELRRYFLKRFQPRPVRVLDCCAGSGVLWRNLSREFEIAEYWPLDLKPGRLKIDSKRILQLPIEQNVVDIDTYGSPWAHLSNLCATGLQRETLVFLTVGQALLQSAPKEMLKAICGDVPVPLGMHARLTPLILQYGLSTPLRHGLTIVHAAECVRPGRTPKTRYFGMILRPPHIPASPATNGTPRKKRSRKPQVPTEDSR